MRFRPSGECKVMKHLDRRAVLGGVGILLTQLANPALAQMPEYGLVQRMTDAFPRCGRLADGSWSGFEVECSQALCRIAGVDLVPAQTHFGWRRSLRMMEEGVLHLLPAVTWRKDRAEYMDFIGIYDVEEIYIVVRKENADATFKSLNDFTRGDRVFDHGRGVVFSPEFDRRLKTSPDFARHFVARSGSSSGDQTGLLLTLASRVSYGRVFGAMTDLYSFNAIQSFGPDIREGRYDPEDLIAIRAGVFGSPPTWLAASRKVSPKVRNDLKDAYALIRRNGEFTRLWRKWYGDRHEPPLGILTE